LRRGPWGVIPIDNTLTNHYGQLIEDAGWSWDHAEERYKVAHDYIFVILGAERVGTSARPRGIAITYAWEAR